MTLMLLPAFGFGFKEIMMKINTRLTIGFILILFPYFLNAHGGETHDKKNTSPKKITQQENFSQAYIEINQEYKTDIKPIFKVKCFDCHSTQTRYPWYYKIPGIKQMIDYDTREAKKHLDMTKDFPFISHETPLKDLKSIQESILEDEMPPLRYLLGHWDARLTQKEKEQVSLWSKKSIQILKLKTP